VAVQPSKSFEFASYTRTMAHSNEKCKQELTTNIWRHSDRPTFNIWKGKPYAVISGHGVGVPLQCQVYWTGYRVFSILSRAPLQIPRK
jgi:hypothetical protein